MIEKPTGRVTDPGFWRRRILWAAAAGKSISSVIWDTDPATWEAMNAETRRILKRHLQAGEKVLDVGCGFGGLVPLLPKGVHYLGIDVSPELVEVARLRYPDFSFRVESARAFAASAAPKSVSWAVCRSVRKMLIREEGEDYWGRVLADLVRTAHQVLILEYEELPSRSVVTDSGEVRYQS